VGTIGSSSSQNHSGIQTLENQLHSEPDGSSSLQCSWDTGSCSGDSVPSSHPVVGKRGLAGERNSDFVDCDMGFTYYLPPIIPAVSSPLIIVPRACPRPGPGGVESPPTAQTKQGDVPRVSRAPPTAHHQLQLTAPISRGERRLRELSAGRLFAPRCPSNFSLSPLGVK